MMFYMAQIEISKYKSILRAPLSLGSQTNHSTLIHQIDLDILSSQTMKATPGRGRVSRMQKKEL